MTNLPVDIVISRSPLKAPPPSFTGAAGAIIDFWGVVRGLEGPENIAGIDYEAHEMMAQHQLELLGHEAGEKFAIQSVILHHRIGFVPTAEPSLFVRVHAGHRGPAFEASRWIIEQLKVRVPIWKHPLDASTREEVPHAASVTDGELPGLATGYKAEDEGRVRFEEGGRER